jgi:uncharacterized protein (DUF2141 family)
MFKIILLSLIGLVLYGCASVQAPEGGPRDTTAPKLVMIFPLNGSTNFKGKNMVLEFNEDVSEDNTKIQFLSPLTPLTVTTGTKRLKISPDSGWQPNTTYVMKLLKKIKDDREGNNMKDTTIVFSTGAAIDSLKTSFTILDKSGKVNQQKFTALLNKEQKVVFSSTTDSLRPLEIKGLSPGKYNLEVFNDKNENYKYEEDEGSLFFDSVRVDSNIIMSITPLPQKYKPTKLFKQRKGDTVVVEASQWIFPNGQFKNNIIAENDEHTQFWLFPVTESYLHSFTDSLQNCYQDTIDLVRIDTGRSLDLIPLKKTISLEKEGKLMSLKMKWNWAIYRYPDSLFVTQDTVWKQIPFTTSKNGINISFIDLKPGKLKMRFDTVTFYNLSGFKKDSIEVSKSDMEAKGIVSGTVENSGNHNIVVELINSKKEIEARSTGKKFNYLLRPGKYSFQVFADMDKDGFFTGGNKEARRKAEPLYVHPEPVELKVGWDLENIELKPGF